jgi:hypothetical protein
MESFAYETRTMDDPFDYGPDLLSDRASFQALIEELYLPDSEMQLDGSRGTSPTGLDTPPSSSGGQDEVFGLETEDQSQAFAQGALMTDMLAGIGGSDHVHTTSSGTNFHGLNTTGQSFQDPYYGLPSYFNSQMPTYTWESYPETPMQYEALYANYSPWTYPAALPLAPTSHFDYQNNFAIVDQSQHIPRSVMNNTLVPHVLHSTAFELANSQRTMTSGLPISGDARTGYPEPSSPDVDMNYLQQQLNTDQSVAVNFGLANQHGDTTSRRAENSAVNSAVNLRIEQPSVHASTSTVALRNREANTVKSSQLPVRNNNARSSGNHVWTPSLTSKQYGTTSRSSSPKAMNKGGRSGGLDGSTRAHANQMRKLGACWICAFQRDQCDAGSPCTRCQDRSTRGSLHMLPCSRIHLSDLVQQFLPATMNRQHRREEIVGFVQKSLGFWRADAPIKVHLTSLGLGHFVWDLHEYEPSSPELLLQKRYKVGISGTWQRVEKRSPPLAVKELNYNQAHKLEVYVDSIVDRYLEEFQAQAYLGEEESCAMFQSELLRALCVLYTSLPDEEDVS